MSAPPQPPDQPAPVARILASRRAGLSPAMPLTAGLPAPLAQLVPRLCDPSWLGFPGATDIDFSPILPVLGIPAIQLGDPRRAGADIRNVDELECQVLDRMLGIFKAPPGWWGYVGSGSTAAIRHAITTAVRQFGEVPVLYSSSGAHTCVAKIAAELRLPHTVVRACRDGSIDPNGLRALADPDRAAVLVATAGTTTTEAVDDLTACRAALRSAGVTRLWVHTDAALAGVPLALSPAPPPAVRLDIPGRPDSLSLSGHKFLAALTPCSVLLLRPGTAASQVLPYTNDADVTLEGCRSGHAVIQLWWVLHTRSDRALAARAEACRDLAAMATERLRRAGIRAWRHPHAMTVVIPRPPERVRARWRLPHGDPSRIIVMPGRDPSAIMACLDELVHAAAGPVRRANTGPRQLAAAANARFG
jgi:histidine decarboxylase